jgi:molybdate transport system ATP-binding protein
MNPLIFLRSPELNYIGVKLSNPFQATVPEGVTVVIGSNAAGKSTLTRIIEKGWNFTTNSISSPRGKLTVSRIEFSDIHTLTGFKAQYYQQRYEASMNDEVPTVGDILGTATDTPRWKELCTRLDITNLLNHKANFLSSGELRKVLVARTMSAQMPDLLILDNPYIGLDVSARSTLNSTLEQIAAEGVSVMLAISDPAEIPDFTDTLIPVSDMAVGQPVGRDGSSVGTLRAFAQSLFSFAIDGSRIPAPPTTYPADGAAIVELVDCTVAYAGETILPSVSWTIKRGEHWALSGPNGCGKSTLLSLIHADNPKAYSNSVTVFGTRRGSGESIWDIKKRIGYISPEMHLYFGGGSSTVVEIVARGLNDTVGCYTRLRPDQLSRASKWLSLLHIEDIAGRRFNTLSSGEQRMTLLARTFIKNPELMILDEPMHGLDSCRKKAVKSIINSLAARDNTSIIYVTHCPDELPECITHTMTLRRR